MSLCKECSKRPFCSFLCPEAEFYVKQDNVPLRELTIGLPKNRGVVDITEIEADRLTDKFFARPRIEQVRTLLATGLSRGEIAKILGISKKTIRNLIWESGV